MLKQKILSVQGAINRVLENPNCPMPRRFCGPAPATCLPLPNWRGKWNRCWSPTLNRLWGGRNGTKQT